MSGATPGTTLKNSHTGEVIYTPPEGEARLRELLANWERFAQRKSTNLDPLVRMAVQHYQFEAIHPFADGNGRTGRILNILPHPGRVLDLPTLYLSRHILGTRADYYRLLGACHFASGMGALAALHADRGREDVGVDQRGRSGPSAALMDETVGLHAHERAQDLLARAGRELIFTQPYSRIANLVERGIAERAQRHRGISRSWCD